VVFIHFTKTRRGYYVAHPELAAVEPQNLPETEITKNYIQYLERVIRANPEMWVWSHRRWKHEWKPEYGDIIA
jgi:KDO2-lipid IV(A) lauroyltransferase